MVHPIATRKPWLLGIKKPRNQRDQVSGRAGASLIVSGTTLRGHYFPVPAVNQLLGVKMR